VLVVKRKRLRLAKGPIGLVSDTHGLVRPEALAELRGCPLILHAGDVGKPEVLDALGRIAPVIAIRGNNDREAWARRLPDVLDLSINGDRVYVIHDVHDLAFDPQTEGIRAVVSGHSHRPAIAERGSVMFINPGSAGPRRFALPVAVGKLWIQGRKWEAETIAIRVGRKFD